MKKYLGVLLVTFFLLGTINAYASDVAIDSKGKIVQWQRQDVINPTVGEMKTYSPIYKDDRFYYGYWDSGQWVVHDGEKELFRAKDDDVRVFSAIPQYFSYWVNSGNGKKMIVQDAAGNKVPIPDNTAYIGVVQKYNDKLDGFIGEPYFHYWLNDKPGYQKGSGTVITADGTALFPRDYYSFMIPNWILGEGFFIIEDRENKELLFKDGALLKKADKISNVHKDKYDLWFIEDGENNSFINLETGWTYSAEDTIIFRNNLEVFLVNSVKAEIKGGSNYGDLKMFRLAQESFTDITPIEEKIIFAAYIDVKGHDTIAQKFLVFTEDNNYGKIFSLLKDGSWDENIEQTTIELPEEKNVNFYGAWNMKENSYSFYGKAVDPQPHTIDFNYVSENKTALPTSALKSKVLDKKVASEQEGMVGVDRYSFIYQEYDSDAKRSKILSLVVLNEKNKDVLFEKKSLQDGFIDKRESPNKFFYKEKDKWSFYDRKEETVYVLPGIKSLLAVEKADLALYKTDMEKGLFLFASKEKIALPEGLDIIALVSGKAEEQTVTLKIKEQGKEKIVKFSWY